MQLCQKRGEAGDSSNASPGSQASSAGTRAELRLGDVVSTSVNRAEECTQSVLGQNGSVGCTYHTAKHHASHTLSSVSRLVPAPLSVPVSSGTIGTRLAMT